MEPRRDLEDAIGHLEQAVQLSPANARYSALLGEAWLLRGDPEAALAPLQNALQRDVHPRVACLMALALLRLQRHADAERFATAAIEEAPPFHRAWFVRAEARARQGRRTEAADDLREAHALAPGDPTYRLRLAGLLVDLASAAGGAEGRERLAEARGLLEPGPPQRSEEQAWRYLLACVLLELGEARRALKQLEGLTWPEPAEVALRCGLARMALGERSGAAADLAAARALPRLQPEADRLLELLERPQPDDRAATRAAPRTEAFTALMLGVTEVLSMPEEPDEATSAELELLQPGGGDTGPHIAKTQGLELDDTSDEDGA